MIYTIGQIEELTGVKSHVLRYWEEVVPGFSPQKDLTGRRTYSQHDLELIYRNMNVDCHNYITDGLTFSKVYALAVRDVFSILGLSFEDGELVIGK